MTSTREIHTYNAETAKRGMWNYVLPVLGYPGKIVSHRGLVWNFFQRELLGRFRGSFLGLFWVLVQPIFLFAIFFLVFGFMFPYRRAGQLDANVWFAIYLFSGILAYSSFSEATTRSCTVVLENGNLVKKVRFPCELLPVSLVLVSMMVYLVGSVLLIGVGLIVGEVSIGLDFLAWPLVVLVQAVMALGLGLLLAGLQVFMRDISHLYMIFAQAWFFLSPVFWNPDLIQKNLGDYWWIFTWNPLYPLLIAHRQALGIEVLKLDGLDSVWYHLGEAAIWAGLFMIVGYSFFCSRKRKFADLV